MNEKQWPLHPMDQILLGLVEDSEAKSPYMVSEVLEKTLTKLDIADVTLSGEAKFKAAHKQVHHSMRVYIPDMGYLYVEELHNLHVSIQLQFSPSQRKDIKLHTMLCNLLIKHYYSMNDDFSVATLVFRSELLLAYLPLTLLILTMFALYKQDHSCIVDKFSLIKAHLSGEAESLTVEDMKCIKGKKKTKKVKADPPPKLDDADVTLIDPNDAIVDNGKYGDQIIVG